MELGDVIRQRRDELGMSQAELARAAGIDARQIRRYESGEQQPSFTVAVAIAGALKISLTDLAGMPSHRVRLSGEWWASWQTFRDGAERIATTGRVQAGRRLHPGRHYHERAERGRGRLPLERRVAALGQRSPHGLVRSQ